MTAETVHVSREQLERRRQEIISLVPGDIAELRERAEEHVLTPDERDLLLELEGIEFLLHDGA